MIEVVVGDITRLAVDVIVNAAKFESAWRNHSMYSMTFTTR